MIQDDNVRSLTQVIIMAKSVIDAGKFDTFLTEVFGNEMLFVVGTDATRRFISDFCAKHNIDPRGKTFDVKPPEGFDASKFTSHSDVQFKATIAIGSVDAGGNLKSGYGDERCTR